MPINFGKAINGLAKVTLRGGVVGKVSFIVSLSVLSLTVVAWQASNILISSAAIGLVFLLALIAMWKLISFADRHPQAALLEGAEFLVHEQIVHASKSNPRIEVDLKEKIQPEPFSSAETDIDMAEFPDQNIDDLIVTDKEK